LLEEGIEKVFEHTGINLKKSRVLVIAPYGFLGNIALNYLLSLGVEVVGLGNIKRRDLFQKKYGIKLHTSFKDVGTVDLVVACNSATSSQLIAKRVELLRIYGKKLVVVDPCEPSCMPQNLFKDSEDKVLRFDACNGYSPKLACPLEPITPWLLRLLKGNIWGCCAEALIISANAELGKKDWLKVNKENMEILRKFLGNGLGQFSLPPLCCFNKAVKDFTLFETE
ncbi:MAG: hypothetical protein AAB653_00480, partial [Patescibacteria group bacterium]